MTKSEIISEIKDRIKLMETSFDINNNGTCIEYGRYAELVSLYELIFDCTYFPKINQNNHKTFKIIT